MKAYAHTKTSKQMFIAAVFLIAKTGKNLCVHYEWINKLWYIPLWSNTIWQ